MFAMYLSERVISSYGVEDGVGRDASPVSVTSTPSSPTCTAMFPPAPAIM